MAAILQCVIETSVTPAEVVKWLQMKEDTGPPPVALENLQSIRHEFLPYLLNFLREQTMHLLQGCPSSSPSPVKTPSSVKKLKRKSTVDSPSSNVATSTPLPRPGSTNRVRLFANSPMDPLTPGGSSFKRKGKPSPNPVTAVSLTFDSPQFNESEGNVSSSSVFRKDWSFDASLEARLHNKSDNNSLTEPVPVRHVGGKHRQRSDPQDKRANSSYTPDSNKYQASSDHHRTKHKLSFGEYLVTPDFEIRKKKSPHTKPDNESMQKSSGKSRKYKSFKFIQPLPETPERINFNISNCDEFPPVGPQSFNRSKNLPVNVKVITPSRRITPTPLAAPASSSPVTNSVFQTVLEPAEPAAAAFRLGGTELQSPFNVLEQERQQLREEREKLGFKKEVNICTPVKTRDKDDLRTPTKTPGKPELERLISMESIRADPELMTYHDELQLIADLYSQCLKSHLVPNITVELYFLVQLLTAKGGEMDLVGGFSGNFGFDDTMYFGSIHNAVFFTVTVLKQQMKLLDVLDKATIRLLAENCRVESFAPDLKAKCQEIYDAKAAKISSFRSASPIGGVSFQADTDNRKNFPSDRAFQVFRKIRDQFYEMLREWEEDHLSPGWNMIDVMGDRIRSLISVKLELANFIHFSRLFQSQLLQMCKSDQQVKSEGEEDELLLSQLKQANPEKFKKLQERFITPSSVGGPCPPPTFKGCQEFFRDFIQAAASPAFNQHLSNTMSSSINEMNVTQFPIMVMEKDEDATVDQEDRDLLSKTLSTLRILGKFLGYVTFLPYQSPDGLPDSMQAEYINMRSEANLVIDIVSHLAHAKQEGHLVLTIPWLVEFLSMMDSTAPQLRNFQVIFTSLCEVYRIASDYFLMTGSLSFLLVALMLGWLFELPIFPEEIFFNKIESTLIVLPHRCLDKEDIVDDQLLNTCCPYLGEIRAVLMGYAVGRSNRTNTIRKITPLSTNVETLTSINERQIQNQLEENFFHNLPASHKRTVDFVADRVASNHIKKFRGSTLRDLMEQGQKFVSEMVKQSNAGIPFDSRTKKKFASSVDVTSMQFAERGRQKANEQAKSYCSKKSQEILALLLPEETSSVVLNMSCQICTRSALDKVNSWLTMHITKAVFLKDLNNELEKRMRQVEKEEATLDESQMNVSVEESKQTLPAVHVLKIDECSTSLSPSDVIIEYKEVLRQMLLGDEVYGAKDVITLLKSVKHIMINVKEVMTGVPKIFTKLSIDTAYAIVFLHPGLWTEPLQDVCLDLWTNELRTHCHFSRSLCMKHVLMISRSTDPKLAWMKLGRLLHHLIQYHLVDAADLENSFMELIQQGTQLNMMDRLNVLVLACSVAQSYHLTRKHRTGKEFLNVLNCLKLFTIKDVPETVKRIQDTIALVEGLNSSVNNDAKLLDESLSPLGCSQLPDDPSECQSLESSVVFEDSIALNLDHIDSLCSQLEESSFLDSLIHGDEKLFAKDVSVCGNSEESTDIERGSGDCAVKMLKKDIADASNNNNLL